MAAIQQWYKQDLFKTKTLFFVLEVPRDQDLGHEDYITAFQ